MNGGKDKVDEWRGGESEGERARGDIKQGRRMRAVIKREVEEDTIGLQCRYRPTLCIGEQARE